jgi:predicted acylesterase/phospholipase RssA
VEPLIALQEKLGVAGGDELIEMISRFIDTWEAGASSWTFADLAAARPDVLLGITAVNVNRGELALFSVETTPDIRILDAVRASSAIPFFFTPWKGPNGDLYCDGAIMEDYPWSMIRNRADTLVVVCRHTTIDPGRSGRIEIDSLTTYLKQLIRVGRRQIYLDKPRYWIAINNQTIFELDIYLDAEGRIKLFNEGVIAGQRWLAYREWIANDSKRPVAVPSGTAGTPPPFADPDSAGRDHDGGSRRLDSHLPRTADETYPSHRPDTGARRRDRRWSL